MLPGYEVQILSRVILAPSMNLCPVIDRGEEGQSKEEKAGTKWQAITGHKFIDGTV